MIGKSLFIGNDVEFTALDAEKDAAAISAWTVNPEFSRRFFTAPARQYAVYEIKKSLKAQLKKADEKRNTYLFAVRKKEKPDLVCLLRVGWVQPGNQTGRLFMDFKDENHMQQFGEEILDMVLRYAFMELSLHKVWVEVSSSETAEINLYEKGGFLREAQRREASFKEGRFYDLLTYSIVKPDWKKTQLQEATQ